MSMPGSITQRDTHVNTHCVRPDSHRPENEGMTSPIAKNLKALRRRAGLTQEALGLACGWSGQGVIGNYESLRPDAREPRASELVALADALGVGVAELFIDTPAHGRRESHPERIDFATMAVATKALLDFVELTGRPMEWATRPELLEVAYRVADSYGVGTSDSLTLTKELAKRIRGLDGDGESAGAKASTGGRRAGNTSGGGNK